MKTFFVLCVAAAVTAQADPCDDGNPTPKPYLDLTFTSGTGGTWTGMFDARICVLTDAQTCSTSTAISCG